MSAFFVTATGTDIGKTFVTAGLIRHLRAQGKPVQAIKPVVSGFTHAGAAESDPAVLLRALGCENSKQEIKRISPWRYAAPLSPDMAARKEGKVLDFDALTAFCRKHAELGIGTLFIEGVGGVMSPLDERHTVLDLMAVLRLPVVLVAGTYLGALSHALTALEVLRARKLKIAALVVNESADSGVTLVNTVETIWQFGRGVEIIGLPRNADRAEFARVIAALGLH